MLSLEHFKMLSPKAATFEMSTGGTPEITFQEVADVAASLSNGCRCYVRYSFAGQSEYRGRLFSAMRKTLREQLKLKVVPAYWRYQINAVIDTYSLGIYLTASQKAHITKLNWWKRKNENDWRIVVAIIDEYDFEVRAAVRDWNEKNLCL